MENQGNLGKDVNKLNIEELNEIAGGEEYEYAHTVLSKILARIQELIGEGISPDSAREQAKNEYWAELLEVCRMNPEPNGCSAEHQAWVLFSLAFGM